jgi:hypothetical protein
LNFKWIDPDPNVTSVDDDFYYIIRAANANESDISPTSNTAGVWTRTFEVGVSAFSLPLEPFTSQNIESFRQDMNATYIKWMDPGLHRWMKHGEGVVNDTQLIQSEGYEVKFPSQTTYTFCGMPGAMIIYDDDTGFLGFDPGIGGKNLSVSIEPNGDVTLTWTEPTCMSNVDWYEVYYSNTRDGFFRIFGNDYTLACPALGFGNTTATISGLGANNPGTRLYFMVVPFNTFGIRGASTYSIGIWTDEYLAQYDTIGLPMKMKSTRTIDWFCNNIPNTIGINYFIYNEQRWGWHSSLMLPGIYDGTLDMVEGYQISTSSITKFTFIGT